MKNIKEFKIVDLLPETTNGKSSGIYQLARDLDTNISYHNESLFYREVASDILSSNQTQSVQDTDGNYNLGVAAIQNVIADANNSTEANILFGETWSGTSTQTLSLPIRVENYNEGSVADNGVVVYNTSIFRKGELKTAPTYKYLEGATDGVLKYGGGTLHRVTILDTAGDMEIYDGLDNTEH